jgi:hypothetical protein
MAREDENKEANTKENERSLDENRKESDELKRLPAFKLLRWLLAFLCTEMCNIVIPPFTIKLLQPGLPKHSEKYIDQNKREAEVEEEEHVHHSCVGGDLKGRGFQCRRC